MSADDFQTKYASVMESMLKSAIAETTKLFENMVDELKAEISKIKQENEDLKTKCFQYETAKSQPKLPRENHPVFEQSDVSVKCDSAVQCDLVPSRTVLVEECQPVSQTSQHNQEHQIVYDWMGQSFREHNYVSYKNKKPPCPSIKQEEPYNSLEPTLKQEHVETEVVSGQAFNNSSVGTSVAEVEREGPRISQESSTEQFATLQKNDKIPIVQQIPFLSTNNSSQGAQNQLPGLSHSIVISLKDALLNDIKDESEVCQKGKKMSTPGELPVSGKQQLVPSERHLANASLVQEQSEATVQHNVTPSDQQLIQTAVVSKEVSSGDLKDNIPKCQANTKPKPPATRRRGRPPKRRRPNKIILPLSANVPVQQAKSVMPSTNKEITEAPSPVFTENISSLKPSEASLREPVKTLSTIPLSIQESVNTLVEEKNREVSSFPVSAAPLSNSFLFEKQSPLKNPQLSMKGKEKATEAQSFEGSLASETQHAKKNENPQAPSGDQNTTATLQDAMLFVEAMNQSVGKNQVTPSQIAAVPQTCSSSLLGSLETPAASQMCPVQAQLAGETLNVSSCHPRLHVSSAAAAQTVRQAPKFPRSNVGPPSMPPRTIIIVPRVSSAVSFNKIKGLSQMRSSTVNSTAHTNSDKSSSTVLGSSFDKPSICSVTQSVSVTSRIPAPSQSIAVATDHQDVASGNQIMSKQLPTPATDKTAPTAEQDTTVFPPSPQLTSMSQESSSPAENDMVFFEENCDMAQNPDFLNQAASVSKTIGPPTETSSSSETSINQVLPSASTVSPSTVEQKLFAVVRLTRFPFPVSTEESVSVSRLFAKGFSEINFAKKPSVSLTHLPSMKAAHVSENSNKSRKRTLFEERSASTYVQLSTSLPVANKKTESSPGPSTADPLTPISDEDISDEEVQEDQTDCLLQPAPNDMSDPHLQMTKTQFLKQLSVSPLQKQSSTYRSLGTRPNGQQKNSIVLRLRSHLQNYLKARRSATEQLPDSQTETSVDTPKKPRLERDGLSVKQREEQPISSRKPDVSQNTSFFSTKKSGNCGDGVIPTKVVSDQASVSSNKSSSSGDSAALSCKMVSSTPMSPRKSSLAKESLIITKATYVSPGRFKLVKVDVGSRNTRSASVSPGRPTVTYKSESFDMTRNDATLKSATCHSLSPKRVKKAVASPEKSIREASTSPDASTFSIFTQVSPGNKWESCSLGSGRNSETTVSPVSNKAKRETSSSNVKCPKPRKSNTGSERDTKSSSIKKPRKIQVGQNVSSNSVMKLTKAVKARRRARIKKSNSEKRKRQLAQNKSTSKVLKKCQAKVWYPPTLPPNEVPSTEIIPAPKLKAEYRIPVIPSNQSPIVSPLQPLSFIGRHLLRNQCGECGRVFNSTTALENHVSLHKLVRPFTCKLCGKYFPDARTFKRHDRVHRNGRIHVCPQCGKGFVYRFGLTKHVTMVHSTTKPFMCQICNKGFFAERDMAVHIRIHTGEKPFQCHLCEKRFTRKVDVNTHLRWHNGEKRHWCPYCGKGFLDANNLKRHKYIHTGEKPYSCSHCPKNFTQTAHLKKHIQSMHGEEGS